MLDTAFARFALSLNCLLAQHRDFLALSVQAVPPMRDDNSSNRGLGPRIATGISGLRGGSASMDWRVWALKPRPDIDSARPLSIFARVPAKQEAKLDDPVHLALAISSASTRCVHRSTHFSPRPSPDSTHGLRNATGASARPELAANAISTYPTPGSTIVPPTTWCEKRASAEGDSAPENTTASSSRGCCGPGASSSQSSRVVSLDTTGRRLR